MRVQMCPHKAGMITARPVAVQSRQHVQHMCMGLEPDATKICICLDMCVMNVKRNGVWPRCPPLLAMFLQQKVALAKSFAWDPL